MTIPSSERRRETRFSAGAQAILRRREGGDTYSAMTLDISTGGLLLALSPNPFAVGDELLCEIALPDAPDQAFASWGVGRVVRVDDSKAAIELKSGVFDGSHSSPCVC
jgi:Tfp pilus assembly protein PilZ